MRKSRELSGGFAVPEDGEDQSDGGEEILAGQADQPGGKVGEERSEGRTRVVGRGIDAYVNMGSFRPQGDAAGQGREGDHEARATDEQDAEA